MPPGPRFYVLLVALGLVTACTDAIIIDRGSRDGAPADGSTADGGVLPDGACRPGDAGVVGAPGCDLRRPPARPVCPPSDAGVDVSLLFALRDVSFKNTDWATDGYDLDGLCTVDGTAPAECAGPGMREHVPDGEGGIDNAFARQIVPILTSAQPSFETDMQARQLEGRFTILLRIDGWNGLPDDPYVEVAFAQGICAAREGDPPCSNDMPGVPAWDGADLFFAGESSFLGGDETMPLALDPAAYVANRTLVVRLPAGVSLQLAGADRILPVGLTDATLTGVLAPGAETLRDVLLVGRWARSDVLSAADEGLLCVTDPAGHPEDLIARRALESALDQALDVMRESRGTMPPAECESVSLGIGFTGWAGRWGGLVAGPMIPDPCTL